MTLNELIVTSMSAFAAQILAQGGPAIVYGITSRGCFLIVRSRWVLFLTPATCRGPLTLNLGGEANALIGLNSGTALEVQEDGLRICAPEINVDLGHARHWEPSERPAAWLAPDERRIRQVEIAKHLLHQPGAPSSGLLISMLLDLPANDEGQVDPIFSLEEVEALGSALGSRKVQRILPAMEKFLGRGPGLTPSGDDLIAGLLLALRRWGDILLPGIDFSLLSQGLLPLAYQKTMTLAANLIECASEGLADERLVSALDGLMVGEPGPAECALQLLDYGSSSGCDAFNGMLLADSSLS